MIISAISKEMKLFVKCFQYVPRCLDSFEKPLKVFDEPLHELNTGRRIKVLAVFRENVT